MNLRGVLESQGHIFILLEGRQFITRRKRPEFVSVYLSFSFFLSDFTLFQAKYLENFGFTRILLRSFFLSRL
jgi:hypothetical protein